MNALSVVFNNVVQEYRQPDGSTNLVLDKINLTIDTPGITAILGPSGCGKSTLMKMAGGVRPYDVVTPTSGEVLLDGVVCSGPTDDAVMVFQQYANRPDLTVWENVYFPFRLKLWKGLAADAKDRVTDALKKVGLSDKKNLYPHQLSGGQNQRVALARALALRPRLLLMDEPFGALDAQTREDMQTLLLTLIAGTPTVVLFVTHDVTEALRLANRVIVLSSHPARIADDFTISTPAGFRDAWLSLPEAIQLRDRVLAKLHASKVSLRVTA